MINIVIVNDKGYSGLNPIQFGYEQCESGHFFGPAVRSFWLIHFVVSGFGKFRIEGKEYQLSPGEMFIIPPNVETYYQADEKKPWNYIWVGFTADGELPANLPHTIKLPEASKIFNEMKSCEDFSDGGSAFLTAKIWELFAHILGRKKEDNDYVKTAIDYIHSEYMKDIKIGEIASKLNIDRTYFYSMFKNKIGISPQKYLLNHRMNIAASLIKNQNISISTVAYSVGYTDIFTFSKMFKKHFGVSPTQYSKQEIK